MLLEAQVVCPFCYQSFSMSVDPSEGSTQSQDLDCEVCCHALLVQLQVDEENQEAVAAAEKAF